MRVTVSTMPRDPPLDLSKHGPVVSATGEGQLHALPSPRLRACTCVSPADTELPIARFKIRQSDGYSGGLWEGESSQGAGRRREM